MNSFFFLNLTTSFIIVNGVFRMFTMKWEHSEYVLNTTVLIIVIAYTLARGRYALIIKNNKLRINSYPFSKTIECSKIKYVNILYRKVEIETTDSKTLVSDFLYGIDGAVHKSVVKAMADLKWSNKASPQTTLNDNGPNE
ncbi:MAG: hypothetical protein ACJA0G_002530 [Kangiellaceae bacterium]|jgi:hypothetical protein